MALGRDCAALQQVITQGCVGSPVADLANSTPSYADERRTLETSRMCLSS